MRMIAQAPKQIDTEASSTRSTPGGLPRGKLKGRLKYFDLVMSMAPRMMVAAVSAPTASSTGEDMSMGAPQVT